MFKININDIRSLNGEISNRKTRRSLTARAVCDYGGAGARLRITKVCSVRGGAEQSPKSPRNLKYMRIAVTCEGIVIVFAVEFGIVSRPAFACDFARPAAGRSSSVLYPSHRGSEIGYSRAAVLVFNSDPILGLSTDLDLLRSRADC
ncbi:hypothetical protein EVAR_62605_1 [Eumeta japonica]|uniref:Uncharacterized protein n=1 Tax=Eumeta variegata TaxID=151549 RepID=A0A4C1ZCT1_EUMVA|nr:hypothetical protein EVAR_62605_1 [Eumeta japonica]